VVQILIGPACGDNRKMEKVLTRIPRDAQAGADLAYWLSRPVSERLAAVEVLRQQAFGISNPNTAGEPDAEPRLQRVCRVVQRSRG
jgi:hypothetical protein